MGYGWLCDCRQCRQGESGKRTQKLYRRHSGPGGMKMETFAHLQARLPERIVEQAVKGMLPKIAGRQLFTKLKVMLEFIPPSPKPQELKINTIQELLNNASSRYQRRAVPHGHWSS